MVFIISILSEKNNRQIQNTNDLNGSLKKIEILDSFRLTYYNVKCPIIY